MEVCRDSIVSSGVSSIELISRGDELILVSDASLTALVKLDIISTVISRKQREAPASTFCEQNNSITESHFFFLVQKKIL